MRLYGWAERGRLVYLVHVEEKKRGRPPRRTLYPFINTHFAGTTPRKGYSAEEVSRGCYELDNNRLRNAGNGDREGTNSTV
jgi:hypothetical protein